MIIQAYAKICSTLPSQERDNCLKMAHLLSLDECLKDSPAFRRDLRKSEQDIDSLSSSLENVIEKCSNMVRKGEGFGLSVQEFLSSLQSVSKHQMLREDPVVFKSMNKLIDVLGELEDLRSLVVEQANRSIADSMSHILKDVKTVKETGKVFLRLSSELDSCRERYSQIPKNKKDQMAEVKNLLLTLHSGFSHTSMDYVSEDAIIYTCTGH
jgi:hypothetical protein